MSKELNRVQTYVSKDTKDHITRIMEIEKRSESGMVNVLITEALATRSRHLIEIEKEKK